jgi:hypothetical protein
MYWLVIEVQGELGLISLQERYLDQRLEMNPEEIVFYAELNAQVDWEHNPIAGFPKSPILSLKEIKEN